MENTTTTFAFRVTADVRYLDGTKIIGGWSNVYPTIEYAQQAAEWVTRCYLAEVEVADGYVLTSAPSIEVA